MYFYKIEGGGKRGSRFLKDAGRQNSFGPFCPRWVSNLAKYYQEAQEETSSRM
jgi:hypothetical protein